MTSPGGMRQALATLGQNGPDTGPDNPWAANGQAEAKGARTGRRRGRRWLMVTLAVAVLAGAGYWQRQPLLQFAAGLPLIGPVVQDWAPAAGAGPDAAPSPAEMALAEERRRLAQLELDLARAEADLLARQQQLEEREDRAAAHEQELAEREAAFAASQPGPGINEVVDIYRNMKPDAAALRLAMVDELTAITVLKRVDREHAARILAAMSPEQAALLSQALVDQTTTP